MKVLFDQNVPLNLARHLTGHEVKTAANMLWEELKNGDLIQAAEESGFAVLVTCDQQWLYQQNLAERKIAIVEITVNN
jgi:predicted nuclease of predicted toxin-antitoxin system